MVGGRGNKGKGGGDLHYVSPVKFLVDGGFLPLSQGLQKIPIVLSQPGRMDRDKNQDFLFG